MSRLVLTNATVLDGEQARLADATVIVDGERIASVTQGGAPAPQPGDEVHDVSGRTVMPGMVTCHFHSAYRELGSRMTPLGSDEPTAYAGRGRRQATCTPRCAVGTPVRSAPVSPTTSTRR